MVMAFVHPAAVVPVAVARMQRVDGAALVCGSVGPDVVDYFVRMSARPKLHAEPLLLVASGVVGGLALFACVVAAGPGIARALPPFLAVRFRVALTRRRALVSVVVSLAVGLATHIAWDAVVERHGAFAMRSLYVPTTVLGVVVLVAGIVFAPRVASVDAAPWRRSFVVVVTSSLLAAALFALVRLHLLEGRVADAMAAGSAGAIVGVVVAGVALRRSRAAAPKPQH